MPEIQAATRLQWADGTDVQAATRVQWADGSDIQSVGSAYTRPTVPGGTVVPEGGLTPTRDITEAPSYDQTHDIAVHDMRTDPPTALPVRGGSISLADGSTLWSLSAEGAGSLYATMVGGAQPPVVRVTINGYEWIFVVESVQSPQAFASHTVNIGGRSLASLADAPHQVPQQWRTDAVTSAAQLAAIANTYTDLAITWLASDWLVPADAWSYFGSPLGVVNAAAAAIQAVVEPSPDTQAVTVVSRYPVLPNKWYSTAPDWQIHWNAVLTADINLADTPAFDGVFVAGQQQGGLCIARLAGTSGALQAPMVTDPLLTDSPGLIERATVVLCSAGKQAVVSRTLQFGAEGWIPRGALTRWVDPDETWVGMVRSVNIQWAHALASQTVGVERRMLAAQVPVAAFKAATASILTTKFYGEMGQPGYSTTITVGTTDPSSPLGQYNKWAALVDQIGAINFDAQALTSGVQSITIPASGYPGGMNVTMKGTVAPGGEASFDVRIRADVTSGRFSTTPNSVRGVSKYMSFVNGVIMEFDPPISAACSYLLDFGDFLGTVRYELRQVDGTLEDGAIPHSYSVNANLGFWGFYNAVKLFDRLRLYCTYPEPVTDPDLMDVFGIDDVKIGSRFSTQLVGRVGMQVHFTSESTNAVAWAWEFYNNGVVQSTQEHPAFFYDAPGVHSVKLTVTSATGQKASVVRTGYVTTGAYTPVAPYNPYP